MGIVIVLNVLFASFEGAGRSNLAASSIKGDTLNGET